MDENQKQDWWPENFSNDFSKKNEPSGQPKDTSPNTANPDSLAEGQTSSDDTYNQIAEPQQSQDSSYNQNNNNQQNQNDSYGWNNNNQQNGSPYYQRPVYRPAGNGMVAAALVMGILSLLLTCCGLSYVFGALGIIFALLSRKEGSMDPQAKIGMGLSITGSVIGIVIIIVALLQDPSYYMDILKEYEQFYNEYENDGDYDIYDDYNDYGNYDNYDDYNADDFFDQFKDFEDFANQPGGYSDELNYQLPLPATSL